MAKNIKYRSLQQNGTAASDVPRIATESNAYGSEMKLSRRWLAFFLPFYRYYFRAAGIKGAIYLISRLFEANDLMGHKSVMCAMDAAAGPVSPANTGSIHSYRHGQGSYLRRTTSRLSVAAPAAYFSYQT